MFLVPSSQLFCCQHNLRKSHWWKLSIAKNSIIPFPDLIFELAQNQEFPSPSDTGSLCSHVVQVISFNGFISIKMLMVIYFNMSLLSVTTGQPTLFLFCKTFDQASLLTCAPFSSVFGVCLFIFFLKKAFSNPFCWFVSFLPSSCSHINIFKI